MAAPSKVWTDIVDGQVDADSPLDTTLMEAIRDNLVHLEEWLGDGYTAAKDHSHDGTDSALISDLGGNVVGSDSLSYAAGDVLINSNDSEQQTTSSTYVLLKESEIARSGELRIKFELEMSGTATSVEARIYVNDSPVGTERSLPFPGASTIFSEDISGLSAGDLVQVYGKVTVAGAFCQVRDFRFHNELPIVISNNS